MRLEGEVEAVGQLQLLGDDLAEAEDGEVVVIVRAHEGEGVIEGEEERLEEADELGEVLVELVLGRGVRELAHRWVIGG